MAFEIIIKSVNKRRNTQEEEDRLPASKIRPVNCAARPACSKCQRHLSAPSSCFWNTPSSSILLISGGSTFLFEKDEENGSPCSTTFPVSRTDLVPCLQSSVDLCLLFKQSKWPWFTYIYGHILFPSSTLFRLVLNVKHNSFVFYGTLKFHFKYVISLSRHFIGILQRSSIKRHLKMPGLQIVLLGKNGSGKSASGNTIIGGDKETFIEGFSPESVTSACQSAHTEVDGKKITVIDTVGLSDTSNTDKEAYKNIFYCTCKGIDVFLLVIKLGNKFTEEEQNAVKWIQKNFGAKASNHTIVLFTHGDHLQETVKTYLSKHETLRSIVDQCAGGHHVFNNKDKDQSQVIELLREIETLREKNRYNRYTEQDYAETQKELLYRKCYTGAAIGGIAGAVGGAIAAMMGAVSWKTGVAVLVGGATGAVGGAIAAMMGAVSWKLR